MSEKFIPEHRRTQFKAKNTFKPDELRRRREEQQVEIRKAKREENLAKRRGITGRDGTQMSAPGASLGASIDSDDEGGTIESQVFQTLFYLYSLYRCSSFAQKAPGVRGRQITVPERPSYLVAWVRCTNDGFNSSLPPNSPKW